MASEYSDRARTAVAEQLVELFNPHESLAAIQDQLRLGFAKMLAAFNQAPNEREIDGWLDSKAAAKYMGNLSKTSFDKYRYQTAPKLKGYPLDGKILYKKSDIDSFVMLYGLKSKGLT